MAQIKPVPTDEEAAAIAAAIEMAWPRTQAAEADVGPSPSRWRFSGRWWNKPVARGRLRP